MILILNFDDNLSLDLCLPDASLRGVQLTTVLIDPKVQMPTLVHPHLFFDVIAYF